MEIKLNTTLFLLLYVIVLFSCEKMNDIHADYVKDGEIIYAVSPDTLIVNPGNLKIQINLFVFNGISIQKCFVEWEDEKEQFQQSMNVSFKRSMDSVLITIDNLKEKSYIFKVYNVDDHGNRSIKQQLIGRVYGSNYKLKLRNRSLLRIKESGTDELELTWGAMDEGYVGTEINYTNIYGEQENIMLLPGENSFIIKGWESESEMGYRSFYLPEPNAIDTFSTAMDTVILP